MRGVRARGGRAASCSATWPARLRGRAGFDDAHMSVRPHRHARREGRPSGVELVPAGGLVERLREVKDEAELRGDARRPPSSPTPPTSELRERGLAGRTEREVAPGSIAAHRGRGRRGRRRFPPIVAAGAARRAAARRAARRRDPARHARGGGPGRPPRRLLLRLHAHARHRPARRRARSRSTSSFAAPRQAALDAVARRARSAARSTRRARD